MQEPTPTLFTKIATRNAQEAAPAEAEATADGAVQTVLRVKRKRSDEAAEVFLLDGDNQKRRNLASMLEESSLSTTETTVRRVFRRVKSGTHAENFAKRCVKAQSAGAAKDDTQLQRKDSESDRRKKERSAQLRSSRYAQCGDQIAVEDSLHVINIEPTPEREPQKRKKSSTADDGAVLCNGSPMVRSKIEKIEPGASGEDDDWVYDFYVVDDQPCSR